MNENLKPKVAKGLLVDLAVSKDENRYGEDVYLLYNPIGYGGVLTVGKDVVDLINLFDGTKQIETAIAEAGFTGEEADQAKYFVQVLIDKQILYTEANKAKPNAWKKELTCWLHITNSCNLNCRYCYIHKDDTTMPDSILYKSLDMMLESCKKNNYETLSLMLVGGEPLTRFEKIKEIVEYCSNNKGDINVRYILPTNGTLITPEVAKYITDNHMTVGVSIDGNEEYHDINRVNRAGKGSYKKAMQGVDNLIAQGVKPSIMVTVTNENLDGLPDLTKILIDKQIYFRFSFERDTVTGMPEILKNEQHCIEVLKECFDIMKKSLDNGKLGWFFKFGDVSFDRPCRRACAAGKNFFAIGQDGSVGSCSLGLESTKTSIFEMDDIITDIGNIFADIGKTSACDVEECKNCIWRHSCAGACPLQTYATYKTYNNVSPYCSLYKACLPDVIRIYAMIIYYNMKKEG